MESIYKGEWIEYNGTAKCSNCGESSQWFPLIYKNYFFCPYCGSYNPKIIDNNGDINDRKITMGQSK